MLSSIAVISASNILRNEVTFALKNEESLREFQPMTTEESAGFILARVDEATRENSGGQFVDTDGTRMNW